MRAGMGDVVFAPLYQVLQSRGVTGPTSPFYNQLVQGQELQQLGIDLEDPWEIAGLKDV